jgi:hypothetical protein
VLLGPAPTKIQQAIRRPAAALPSQTSASATTDLTGAVLANNQSWTLC